MPFNSSHLPPELEDWRARIEVWAKEYGLNFYRTIFEVLDWNEMNMVAAYGGFPNRYPHWRFGMEYDQLAKSYAYGLSKIYEMVINNDPCYAYLLHCNKMIDQKMVMAHVFGHCDFFKNNIYFAPTAKNMMDQMANHKTKVVRLVDKLGFDAVETFIDVCLSIENLIDYQLPFTKPRREEADEKAREREAEEDTPRRDVDRLRVDKHYLETYINPKEFLDSQRKRRDDEAKQERKFPPRPDRDVMGFLLNYAPLDRWEYDVLDIVRREAYYFAPQAQTKIMNEGWACVAPDTLVYTEQGLIPMRDLVAGVAGTVSDGRRDRSVYDQNIIPDRKTITVETRRGLKLCGSDNHRVLGADGETWKRLDELSVGDRILVSGGCGLWPKEEQPIRWRPACRVSLQDVALSADVSIDTVLRYRSGANVRRAQQIAVALEAYEVEENLVLPHMQNKRAPVRLPECVTPELGALLGYLVGDGHISRVKRNMGLTTGDREQAECFSTLANGLFGVPVRLHWDDGRYRVLLHSETLSDFFVDGLGLTTGPSAAEKKIPEVVLRSPEPVVRAFLSAYFDCDGYAGKQGVILSSMSRVMIAQTQLLLLNYDILSRVRRQKDGCYHLHIMGFSAARFSEKIGFGLKRKSDALASYVARRRWFKKEESVDEIVSLTEGRGDVYDISVDETHRYAAAGMVNHNSYWHSTIMTRKALTDGEVIDFADHHSGTTAMSGQRMNPYKIGIELFRHIEERWDKGQFGKEYDDCDDIVAKKNWDKKLGGGRAKIFDVRRIYNDITFIDEYFTPEFCRDNKLFAYTFNPVTNQYEISDRDFVIVKQKILQALTNFGQPRIAVVDANFSNRAELMLIHEHDGIDLDVSYAQETLKNLHAIWKRPVLIESKLNNQIKIYKFDGDKHHTMDSQIGL